METRNNFLHCCAVVSFSRVILLRFSDAIVLKKKQNSFHLTPHFTYDRFFTYYPISASAVYDLVHHKVRYESF